MMKNLLFTFLVLHTALSEDGLLNITVEPTIWVTYPSNVVVTFYLKPPCFEVSVFRSVGDRQVCVFGALCPFRDVSFEASTDGDRLRVKKDVALLKTGSYFAKCTSPSVVTYKTAGAQDGIANFVIGVNPRVFSVTFEQGPEFLPTNHRTLERSSRNDGFDLFTFTGLVSLNYTTFAITFVVDPGRSLPVLPSSSATAHRNTPRFAFQIADFDLPQGKFWFARRYMSATIFRGEASPALSMFGYSFKKTDLATVGVCHIKGTAVANLRAAEHDDIVNFYLNVAYSTTIGAIIVERKTNGRTCGCVFTCKAHTCPKRIAITKSEWAFFDNSSQNAFYLPGNVKNYADRYEMSSDDCQQVFRLSKKLPFRFNVQCRVYTENLEYPADTRSEPLFELLRPCRRHEEFQCIRSVQCVAAEKRCDGKRDCLDGSDEEDCILLNRNCGKNCEDDNNQTESYRQPLEAVLTVCRPGFFKCNRFGRWRCVPVSMLCDGKRHCRDFSDEGDVTCAVCPENRFHCANSICIDPALLCNGADDCNDGSDEAPEICHHCSLLSQPSVPMWRCQRSGRCIHASRLCNQRNDCGFGDDSDESLAACKIAAEQHTKNDCPERTIKCTSNLRCVPYRKVCDGVSDCCFDDGPENATHIGDCEKSDEINCRRNASCQQYNGGCQQICIPIVVSSEPSVCGGVLAPREGAYCACRTGFTRPFDSPKMCGDVDECQRPFDHNCSHVCMNTVGSFSCSCAEGFSSKLGDAKLGLCTVISRNNKDKNTLVVFSNNASLQVWKSSPKSLDKFHVGTIKTLDIDIRSGTMFLAAKSQPNYLYTIKFPWSSESLKSPLHVPIPIGKIVDISVDFIGRNVYVVDSLERIFRIVVLTTYGRYAKIIKKVEKKEVTSIAVNPVKGRLYYGTYKPTTILMTSMDGDKRFEAQIYSKIKADQVRTIVVDFLGNGRIYFSIGSQVMIANFDGSSVQTSMFHLTPGRRAFDVFNNAIFGAFQDNLELPQRLVQLDKFGRFKPKNLTEQFADFSTIRVYHPLKAGLPTIWPNPCEKLHCNHICLLSADMTASCGCSEGVENCTHHAFEKCKNNCPPDRGFCKNSNNFTTVECKCKKGFSGENCKKVTTKKESQSFKAADVTIHLKSTLLSPNSLLLSLSLSLTLVT